MIRRLVQVQRREIRAVAWSFVYFFSLLGGYYVVRPVRDELAIGGSVDLEWLFTGTFVVMLVVSPAFSALVSRVPRRRSVPWTYHFFALNLVGFSVAAHLGAALDVLGVIFFVWLSVYNLFVVSVGWSLMADLFTEDQGKRLFGLIAAGGSAGAIAGPLAAALLARSLGPMNLLLITAALLEVCVLCVVLVMRDAPGRATAEGAADERRRDDRALGGSMWDGIRGLGRSGFLRAIAAQTVLLTFASTILYFHQQPILREAIPDRADRTALLATIDLAVNLGALLVQGLLTARIVTTLGLGFGLAVAPALSALGFGGMAMAPTLGMLMLTSIARRASHYGIERPAREALFTTVPRDQKYKAKSFIDTVVYRGGDVVAGWGYAGAEAAGLGLVGLSIVAIPICAAGVGVAIQLGRGRGAAATTPEQGGSA